MIRELIVFSLLLIMSSCVENLGEFEGTKSFYVVNGTITNEYGPHAISIRNTAHKNVLLELTELKDVAASIIDDQGIVTTLKAVDVGEFVTPDDFRAELGRSYRIEVVLTNGWRIVSKMEELVEVPLIDDFTFEVKTREKLGDNNLIFEERYVAFTANLCDPESVANFYKWEYTGTYEYLAYLAEIPYLPHDLDRAKELGLQSRFCWKNFFGNNLLQIDEDLLFNGACLENLPVFEREIDFRFQIAAYFELQQYAITEREYNYLSELENQFNNKGTIFETGNYQIKGNLSVEDQEDVLVLGFFGVRGVTKAHTLVTSKDVDYVHNYDACIIPSFNGFPGYCFDCRSAGDQSHENIRPDFWPK